MNSSVSHSWLTAAMAIALVATTFLASSSRAAIAIDAQVSTDRTSASKTVVSPAFSTTSSNELLLAFVESDYKSGANTTVTTVSGAGLTWVLVVRTNAQSGSSEIWRAFAPSTLSGVTVTATLSQSVLSSMTVLSFSGVNTAGTNGSGAIGATASANAKSGAPTTSLVTTGNGSWVFGAGNDFDNAIARTPGAGQSLVHQDLTSAGDTYWVQMQNAPTPNSGTTVTINDTAPTGDRYNLSLCEVLAASGSVPNFSLSGNVSPSGSGVTMMLTGTSSATTATDSSGNYSFANLIAGSYTVTPSKSGYTFDPTSQAATISTASVSGINFAATPPPTWSISGTITPAGTGAGALVTLGGAAGATTTANASGNYAFSNLVNGTYSITPSNSGYTFNPATQNVTVSGANVTAPPFTGQAATSAALAIDVQASTNAPSANTTIATPAFSTKSANELLLAFVATDYLSGTNTTVTAMTGAGLTWTLVLRTNVQSGSSEIWRAFAAAPLGSVSVSATLSQKVVASITVVSFTGADASGTNGSGGIGAIASTNAKTGAPTASLVTTRSGSWVFGVGNDFDNAIERVPVSGQSLLQQYMTPTGDTYWVQMQNNANPVAGTTVTIKDTAPTTDRYNLSIAEVLPAVTGGGGITPPTINLSAPAPGATVSGLTNITAGVTDTSYTVSSVQFILDGANLGSPVTVFPYSMAWDTTTASAGTHNLSATVTDGGGQSATAAPVTVSVDNTGNPAVVGSWSSPVSTPAVAVNLILLYNNKILFYQDGSTVTVWDYVNNKFTNTPTSVDLFCSGATALSDGRILSIGGYGGSSSDIGISNAEIFDPSDNTWTAVPKMSYRRWYPTGTTLSDGRVLVTAGWQTTNHSNAGIPEIYDPSTNSWASLASANNPFETYPFVFMLGDGRIIHVGGSEYATDTDVLDINSQTWTVLDPRIVDGGSATMYLPGMIMKAGSATDSQNVGPSSNTTFVMDTMQPSPSWVQTPSMVYPRSFLNLTELPDGTVLATGGETDKNGGTIANAVYAAELWSPTTQTWTTMASMHTPREYHSTALLLPDGRVLQSGMGADFGNVPDEDSAEFFSPPYLFKGARPTISQAPPAQIQYGTGFFVGTPDAANIKSAVLIRTGAVTHFFDQNTRYVPLTFQQTSGGLTLTAPADAYQAPPGYYMLFLVNNNGVPSVAPFVQLAQ